MPRILICTLIGLMIGGCGPRLTTVRNTDPREELERRANEAHRDLDRASRRSTPKPKKTRPVAKPAKMERAAHSKEVSVLPDVPSGFLWADGHGATMHEAVAAARAGVSQQVSAQISSDLKMVEAQYDGQDESRARHTVRTSSSFEHLELIKTLGVMKGESSFVARVALDTERASRSTRKNWMYYERNS